MKNFKRISLIFLISLVLFSIKTFAGYEIGEINSLEDPLYDAREAGDSNNANANNGIMLLNAAPDRTENINSIISKFEDGTAAVGIDVSSWQGEINWSSVANSGVKFAILRCGYRGTSQGQLFEDPYFKKNIQRRIIRR